MVRPRTASSLITLLAIRASTSNSFSSLALAPSGTNTYSGTRFGVAPLVLSTHSQPLASGARQQQYRPFADATTTKLRGGAIIADADVDLSLWDGSDVNSFEESTHPGYSRTSDPERRTGGWLAHQLDPEDKERLESCWVKQVAPYLTKFEYKRPPRILVLYGSLRPSSFSRKLAYEFARLLEELGCDVRTYNPQGLPVRDPSLEDTCAKVKELRALSVWSEGHVWVSPEMHGTTTGVFKNQIDWLPLNTGSVRPTQGRTCMVAQVNGGSQSFNVVNHLRVLARWMRMPCCTNQSSVPKAWQEFYSEDEQGNENGVPAGCAGRMKDSPLRDRVIDVAEEFSKFTAVMAPIADDLVDRYSERKEKAEQGRLLTQAEKEKKMTIEKSRQT
jgi:arsenic resistance protein ArsH